MAEENDDKGILVPETVAYTIKLLLNLTEST